MRSIFFVFYILSASLSIAQDTTSNSLPDYVAVPKGIDIAQRRTDLFERFPSTPNPVTLSGLKELGLGIHKFEQEVISGIRGEIDQVCRDAKDFERTINSLRANNSIEAASWHYFTQHIANLRSQCDTKHVSTSSYWALEADLRRHNTELFSWMREQRRECDYVATCRNS